MNQRTKYVLMAVGGTLGAFGIGGLMIYAAFSHRGAVDVVTGADLAATPSLQPAAVDPQVVLPFDATTILSPGRTAHFPGGFDVTLRSVANAACADATKCGSGQELTATFDVVEGKLAKQPGTKATLRLSKLGSPFAAADAYILELKDIADGAASFAPHLLVQP